MKKSKLIIAALVGFLLPIFPVAANKANAESSDPQEHIVEPERSAYEAKINYTAKKIADEVTAEAKGLLFVPYAEVPRHFLADGKIHYGAHYNLFVVKRFDLLADEDLNAIFKFAARIIFLTREFLFKTEKDVTHMGIQIVPPSAWSYGEHQKDFISVLEIPKDAVMDIGENAPAEVWMGAGDFIPQIIIPRRSRFK